MHGIGFTSGDHEGYYITVLPYILVHIYRYSSRRKTNGHISRPHMYVPGYTVLTSQAARSKCLGSLKARNLLSRDVTALTSQERFCTRELCMDIFRQS
jgi:hypothetical protein